MNTRSSSDERTAPHHPRPRSHPPTSPNLSPSATAVQIDANMGLLFLTGDFTAFSGFDDIEMTGASAAAGGGDGGH